MWFLFKLRFYPLCVHWHINRFVIIAFQAYFLYASSLVCTLPARSPEIDQNFQIPVDISFPAFPKKKDRLLVRLLFASTFIQCLRQQWLKHLPINVFNKHPSPTSRLSTPGQFLVRQNEDKPSELILQGTTRLVKTNNYIFVCVWMRSVLLPPPPSIWIIIFKTTTELESRWDGGKIIHHKACCLAEIQLVFLNKCSQVSWISAPLFNFHNCKKAILTFLPHFTAFIEAEILEFLTLPHWRHSSGSVVFLRVVRIIA